MIKNFMTPPPPGVKMLKKYVTPIARSAENMHFGAISLNKNFIKIWSHPIIPDFFLWHPLFLMKKFCDPPAFSCPPPPYSEENDSPLIISERKMNPGSYFFEKSNIGAAFLWPAGLYFIKDKNIL